MSLKKPDIVPQGDELDEVLKENDFTPNQIRIVNDSEKDLPKGEGGEVADDGEISEGTIGVGAKVVNIIVDASLNGAIN